ncbi:rod-binding protein [Mesorhizobium sp. ZMM04-4]
MPIAPPSQIGVQLTRQPALPELTAARPNAARDAGGAAFEVAETEAAGKPASAASPESFKRFEAMVLQTFIQNMLPEDGAAVYGNGLAGDMWKSLLAGKMADAIAERGGIGIADRVLGAHYATAAKPTDAMPDTPAMAGPGESSRHPVAPGVLDGMQRALSALIADNPQPSDEIPVQSTSKRG